MRLFAENADFSAQKSVFLLHIYGSFGGWWHKVRQGESKEEDIFNIGILLIINKMHTIIINISPRRVIR